MRTSRINTVLTLALCLVCFSCKKSIEEKPYSFLTPDNYFQNENDAYTALIGAYNALGTNYYARFMFLVLTLPTDENASIAGDAAERQLDALSYSPTLSPLLTLWRSIYGAIMRANIIIDRLPAVPMDEGRKGEYISEARFLRALSYFNAVRLWGEIPVVRKEIVNLEDAYIEKTLVKDVYAFIIEDLEYAIQELPNKNPDGRAGKGAATALLAKVYLTRASSGAADAGDYQHCADLCKSVLEMPEFHLVPDFQKAIGAANEFNSESLFEWQGDRELNGDFTSMAQFALPSGVYGLVPENATGESRFGTEPAFFNAISDSDYRKESTYITSGKDISGNTITWKNWPFPYPSPALKLIDQTSSTRSGYAFSANFVVLRLADVYLMRAEALNEIGGPGTEDAYEMINAIRTRARNRDGNNITGYPENVSGLSQETFRDAVLEERRIELANEGHRWFDLVRTKRLLSTISKPSLGEKNYLFPIPNTEILLSKGLLTQNPGW